MGVPKDYEDCYAYLSAQFPEVGGCEFYSELFPDNEKAGELHTDFPVRMQSICTGMKPEAGSAAGLC